MNTWFTYNLGDPTLAEEALTQIKELYNALPQIEKSNEALAVYFRHESGHGLHCNLIIYFTPLSKTIATACRATICQKPKRNGLGLLIGSENSWAKNFD